MIEKSDQTLADKDKVIRQLEKQLVEAVRVMDNIVAISSRNHGILERKYKRFLELSEIK